MSACVRVCLIPAPPPSGPGTRPKPFLERSVDVALLAASGAVAGLARLLPIAASLGATLLLTLQADNDFYSQVDHLRAAGLPHTTAGLKSLPPFLPCPKGACVCV